METWNWLTGLDTSGRIAAVGAVATSLAALFTAVAAFASLRAARSASKSARASEKLAEAQLTADVCVQFSGAPSAGDYPDNFLDPAPLTFQIVNVGLSTVWVTGLCRCWYVCRDYQQQPPPIDVTTATSRHHHLIDTPIAPGGYIEIAGRPDLLHPEQAAGLSGDRAIDHMRSMVRSGAHVYFYGFVEIRGMDQSHFRRGFCLVDTGRVGKFMVSWPKDSALFHYRHLFRR